MSTYLQTQQPHTVRKPHASVPGLALVPVLSTHETAVRGALHRPGGPLSGDVLQLQSVAGNRAVAGLLEGTAAHTSLATVQRQAGSSTPGRVKAEQVVLEFVPDEGIGADGKAMGAIRVKVDDKEVATFPARGGPPEKGADRSNPGRSYGPTPSGEKRLGPGKPHVSYGKTDKEGKRTPPWAFSQLAWGTKIRDADPHGGVLFYRGRKWHSTMKDLEVQLSRQDVLNREQEIIDVAGSKRTAEIPETWNLNDFGQTALQVGYTTAFIHTTPETEEAYKGGQEEKLVFSHGCIHIKPSDRDIMVERGYLQKGVRIDVKAYRSETRASRPQP